MYILVPLELFRLFAALQSETPWISDLSYCTVYSPTDKHLAVCSYCSRCVCVLSCFSHVRLFVTPRTVARQAPLSMAFSRQEYWSGLPCSPLGALPDPGIESTSLTSPALAGRLFNTSHLGSLMKRVSQVEVLGIESGALCMLGTCSIT